MSVRSAQSITVLFSTRAFATGAATDATGTPSGTLYVNGTADAASVTVTNITTGLYKAAVTLPTLAIGDVVDLRINATVSGVADNAVIWRDTKDVLLGTDGAASADVIKLLGTAWLTPGTAGTPDVNTINAVALAGTQTFNNTGTWTGNLDGNVQGNIDGNIDGNVGGDVGGNVNGTVGATLGTVTVAELNPDALADVRDALGMATNDLDTQLDAILAAGGGGGLTAAQTRAALGMAAANLDTQLATITAKTNLITSGNVTIVSPVNDDGSSIAIYRGDDYLEADDRHLQFVVDNVPSLVGATVLLKIKGKEPIEGTVVDATNMWFEMARVFTEELTGTDTFPFEIEVELASGSYCTPFVGVLTASGQL